MEKPIMPASLRWYKLGSRLFSVLFWICVGLMAYSIYKNQGWYLAFFPVGIGAWVLEEMLRYKQHLLKERHKDGLHDFRLYIHDKAIDPLKAIMVMVGNRISEKQGLTDDDVNTILEQLTAIRNFCLERGFGDLSESIKGVIIEAPLTTDAPEILSRFQMQLASIGTQLAIEAGESTFTNDTVK
jgi:hypothetical protein